MKVTCKDHNNLYASIEQIDNMYDTGSMLSCAVCTAAILEVLSSPATTTEPQISLSGFFFQFVIMKAASYWEGKNKPPQGRSADLGGVNDFMFLPKLLQ